MEDDISINCVPAVRRLLTVRHGFWICFCLFLGRPLVQGRLAFPPPVAHDALDMHMSTCGH